MRHKVTRRIESHLDEQLGMWTRLLPWRRELAVHIEQAYERAQAETTKSSSDDDAWKTALADFGNVQDVARELQKEHWPQYVGWRIFTLVVAALVMSSISGWMCLLDVPAACFTLGPMLAFVLFDACLGSTRWELALRVGVWGGLCGTILGTVSMVSNLADPSNVGAGMALSILSALYCVLFFTPQRSIVIALIMIAVVDMGLAIVCMSSNVELALLPLLLEQKHYWNGVDASFVLQVLTIGGVGVCIGIARFGFHGVARHAPSLGAGTFLVSLVIMLGDLSDHRTIIAHLLVAFGAMTLGAASSHCVSDCSRFDRRILS